MQDKPSLLLSGILLIASGISAILAGRIHGDDLAWLKLIFILLACVTGFYGLLYLVGWIVWTAIDARAEAASLTTLLVTAGWADPAAGNRSARLTVPWR